MYRHAFTCRHAHAFTRRHARRYVHSHAWGIPGCDMASVQRSYCRQLIGSRMRSCEWRALACVCGGSIRQVSKRNKKGRHSRAPSDLGIIEKNKKAAPELRRLVRRQPGTHKGVRVDVAETRVQCMDMCRDMCTVTCMDMCRDTCTVYRHVQRHVYSVWTCAETREQCMDMCRDMRTEIGIDMG